MKSGKDAVFSVFKEVLENFFPPQWRVLMFSNRSKAEKTGAAALNYLEILRARGLRQNKQRHQNGGLNKGCISKAHLN